MNTTNERPSAAVVIAILAGAYIAAQMMSDIASLKIITIFGRGVDAGTLVYPITFTIRDMIHKVAGKQVARTLIFTAAAINVAMAGLFWVVSQWSGDPSAGEQLAFADLLAPVWRIVLASMVAEIVSEMIDTEAYEQWVKRFGAKYQWGRVLSSNAIAIPIDSVIFVLIAFVGDLPGSLVWEILWLNVVFKGAVTLISLPWIYLVKPEPKEQNESIDA